MMNEATQIGIRGFPSHELISKGIYKDPLWPACLSCAVVDRARKRLGVERQDLCRTCFERHCWPKPSNTFWYPHLIDQSTIVLFKKHLIIFTSLSIQAHLQFSFVLLIKNIFYLVSGPKMLLRMLWIVGFWFPHHYFHQERKRYLLRTWMKLITNQMFEVWDKYKVSKPSNLLNTGKVAQKESDWVKGIW